jgi:hypothetical protein
MRAPSRDVEDLMPCRLERGDKKSAIAGRAFDADDCLTSIVGDEPVAKFAHPCRAVDEAERAELAAALIQQCSDVCALVHIDPDDHCVLLSRG